MNADELAGRYGLALLTLAEDRTIRHRIVEDLKALTALIGRDSLTRNFVDLLVGNRREALLPEIVQFLETKLDVEDGRVEVIVESALPIMEDDRADLLRRLTQWLNKKVQLKIVTAPELLAGITIRIGDHLIDGSCRGQLARMRQVLMA